MTASSNQSISASSADAQTQPTDGVLTRLRRHLGWIITIKVMVIAGLFYAFFSPAHRLDVDEATVAGHLLRQSPAADAAMSPTVETASPSEHVNPTVITGD